MDGETLTKRARRDEDMEDGLTREQREVFEEVTCRGTSCFITGPGGTGKSFLLKKIISHLRLEKGGASVAVTSTTGVGAVSLNVEGACTLHSWSGVGLADVSSVELLARVESNYDALHRWRTTHHLVVDEISMLSATLLDALDFIARCIRRVNLPFGGMQIILTGDFAQLPPTAGRYCFQSKVWPQVVNKVMSLTQPMRQRDDDRLFNALCQLRMGNVTDETIQLFNQHCYKSHTSSTVPTKLFPRKKNVETENDRMMKLLPKGGGIIFRSMDKGKETSLKQLGVAKELPLKIGAQVMLVRSLSKQLPNGLRGEVIAFDASQKEYPVVKFISGTSITVEPILFTISDGSREIASRMQLPLILAWATTVHRSQGATLQHVEIDLQGTFDYGQAYVALSRCVSLDTLTLTRPLKKEHIKAHPDVVDFYKKHK